MAIPSEGDRGWLARVPRWAVAVTVGLMLLAVYRLDRATELSPDLTVLYLIPIVLATYEFGLGWGLFVTAAAALGGSLAHPHGHVAEVAVDTATHYAVFLITALAVYRLSRDLRTIRQLKARRDFDLAAARGVNLALLEPPRSADGFGVGWRASFARELGGDYYLVRPAPRGLFVCIGDISGKGVQAALFTALLHGTVTDALGEAGDLGELMQAVNRRLCKVLPPDMFVTLLCALLTESELRYVNAGHEPGLLRAAGMGDVAELTTEGLLPLGIMEDVPAPVSVKPVHPGDVLVCYTDGVTDSSHFRERPDDLVGLVREADGLDAQAIADRVFRAAVPDDAAVLPDDTTVLVIRWTT